MFRLSLQDDAKIIYPNTLSSDNLKKARLETGFSVVEFIIATAILAIIITVIFVFLTSSLHVSELNTAHSELRSNISLAIELIASELYSAGSIGVATEKNGITCDWHDVNSPREPAFKLDDNTTRLHAFTVRYCDPYTRKAKKISYKVQSDRTNNNLLTLKRNERGIDSNGSFPKGSFQAVIPGIVGLELELQCKPTDTTSCNPISKEFNYKNILAITIKIAAQTPFKARKANQDKYFFGLESDSDSVELVAEQGYLYEYTEQTIHLINLGID